MCRRKVTEKSKIYIQSLSTNSAELLSPNTDSRKPLNVIFLYIVGFSGARSKNARERLAS